MPRCFTRGAVPFLGLRDLRQHCIGSVALSALLSIVAVAIAGCGGGRVDKNSDAYSDGEACGRIYALTYNEKTMEPTPLSETVVLCQYNHDPNPNVYAAKGHAELRGAELVVTYSTNTYPHFVRLHFSRRG
jgi:hypothetical protein